MRPKKGFRSLSGRANLGLLILRTKKAIWQFVCIVVLLRFCMFFEECALVEGGNGGGQSSPTNMSISLAVRSSVQHCKPKP